MDMTLRLLIPLSLSKEMAKNYFQRQAHPSPVEITCSKGCRLLVIERVHRGSSGIVIATFSRDALYVFGKTKVNKKDGATSPLAPLDLTLDRPQADRRLVILDRETFPRRRTSDQNNCSGREGSHQTNNVIRSIYKQF